MKCYLYCCLILLCSGCSSDTELKKFENTNTHNNPDITYNKNTNNDTEAVSNGINTKYNNAIEKNQYKIIFVNSVKKTNLTDTQKCLLRHTNYDCGTQPLLKDALVVSDNFALVKK
jgi:hypothetical protein